ASSSPRRRRSPWSRKESPRRRPRWRRRLAEWSLNGFASPVREKELWHACTETRLDRTAARRGVGLDMPGGVGRRDVRRALSLDELEVGAPARSAGGRRRPYRLDANRLRNATRSARRPHRYRVSLSA